MRVCVQAVTKLPRSSAEQVQVYVNCAVFQTIPPPSRLRYNFSDILNTCYYSCAAVNKISTEIARRAVSGVTKVR